MTSIRSRSQWGARSPRRRSTGTMADPSTGHYNGPDVTVRGQKEFDHRHCDGLVRGIQNFHMDGRGWNDIAYNYVICPHGVIYEGRGLNTWNGANGTNHGNQNSHAVMWLAGEGNAFTMRAKAAFRSIVKYISERTAAPYRAIGHRDHKSTACPGDTRYAWIRGGMKLDSSPRQWYRGDKGKHVDFARAMLNIVQKYRRGRKIAMTGPVDDEFLAAVREFQEFCERFIQMTSHGRKHFGSGPPFDGLLGPLTREALADWVQEALK